MMNFSFIKLHCCCCLFAINYQKIFIHFGSDKLNNLKKINRHFVCPIRNPLELRFAAKENDDISAHHKETIKTTPSGGETKGDI